MSPEELRQEHLKMQLVVATINGHDMRPHLDHFKCAKCGSLADNSTAYLGRGIHSAFWGPFIDCASGPRPPASTANRKANEFDAAFNQLHGVIDGTDAEAT